MVNDHSDDNGLAFLLQKQNEVSIKLIVHNLPDNKQFKKSAIEEGVSIAKGNLIVTSDADTSRQNSYLSGIASFYEKKKPAMMILPVMLEPGNTFFERFQVLEFLSLQWITFSFAGNSNAILCNGANLAFEKELFERSGGFKNTPSVVSGDDFFLLMKLRKEKKNTISVLLSKDVVVKTKAISEPKGFVQQRIRWAGKTKHAKNISIYLTGILNVLLSFYLLLLPFIEYQFSTFPFISVLFWLIKISGDLLMLRKAGRFFDIKINLMDFLISILYYPIYICSIFILSLIIKPKWKGREIQ
jgi:cellulose synthase/poly-beta-1,6-N-acetylglucosamine synthase-like glycosyltransferase